MKKLMSLFLVLALLAGAITASAAYTGDAHHFTGDDAANTSTAGTAADTAGDPIASKDVTVKIQTSGTPTTTHVYALSYSATELTFTYNMGGNRIWNPETLRYENKGAGGNWAAETQEITVTNYSDLGVKVTAAVDQSGMAENGNVTVTAVKKGEAGAELSLGSAYNSSAPDTSAATSGIFTVQVAGAPVNEYTTAVQLAKITLTVAKAS